MTAFCKYKHIFGKEGQGIHSIRLMNFAIVDVLGTIIGAVILAWVLNVNPLIMIVFAFVMGILFHRLFCVNTTLNKTIFGVV
jgi:hypothetical protein